jgi:plasmid stabilization system protein ParE
MRRYRVRILPSAYNDLSEARNWYRQHNPDLPKRFLTQVNLSIDRIRQSPYAYAIRYKQVHIANVNIFPYAIHYLITEETIVVIAIHHSAMSPDKWYERLHLPGADNNNQ